ncbi:MAG: transcription-repair coupling factor, partial [Burkholderiaceae bacterium]
MSPDANFPQLPKPGTRFVLPALHGAAEALVLAQAAHRLKQDNKTLVVIVADAPAAQRLLSEISWFGKREQQSLNVHLLPDWETLPYDAFSPHQDLVSERLATLHELQQGQCDVLIAPATTVLLRMGPPSFLAGHTFFFKQGETLAEAKLRSQLTLAGYAHVGQVMSPGEYSIRGGLIDLFPMGSALPYRLDLFGDSIESIRTFDVDTQRSLYPVREVRLLPGREFPMDDAARSAFRSRWREVFEGDPSKANLYRDIGNGIASAGIEYYLPLFFDQTATLFDYLPEASVFALVGNIDESIQRFWSDTRSRFQFLRADRERPLLPPEAIFLSDEDFFAQLKPHGRWVIQEAVDTSELSAPIPDIAVNRRLDDPLASLRAFVEQSAQRVMICADSGGRRETLRAYFDEYALPITVAESLDDFIASSEKLMLCVAPLYAGTLLQPALGNIALIT